ncbi:MAG: hypothetical protein IJT50_02595 [Lentisphaeria bacterium]|nr:hypothetical protein [Lentisphaeria bacterium]
MKEWITNVGYWLLALIMLLLEALFWGVIGLPYRLWAKLSYEAQCLRYPGGGWGHSMKEGTRARAEKNRQDKPDRV